MANIDNYNTPIKPTWCPGCGDYAIWTGIKKTLSELELDPHEVVITYDIGCSGNMADKINTYAFKTLHGRTVAAAAGVKIGNPKNTVIAIGGDGGIFEEGINHLMWAARSNYNMTVFMHNNQRFGLTTGQPTTTTKKGETGKTAPAGIVESSINPEHVALISNATFVARAFAGDPVQLVKLMKAAITHEGFAFLDILQPCVTFNKKNTFSWFKERVYKLEEKKDYDPSDWDQAFEVSKNTEEKIATGIIYEDKSSIPYSQTLAYRKGKKTSPTEEVKKHSVNELIKEFS